MRTKQMKKGLAVAVLAVGLTAVAPASTAVAGDALDGATVEQIIEILHDKGLIDGEQQERLLMKNAAEADHRSEIDVAAGVLDGWDLYGDFRLRHEVFTFRHDTNGNHEDNRYRWRYRVRLGFEKKLLDSVDFGMRFATGGTPSASEDRSTNQTLGRQEDFDYDSVRIDRAYVRWALPETHGLQTTFIAGKIPNPFMWKNGKDALIWDGDIQPEGGALMFTYPIDERSELFANTGYFIVDENSNRADPKLWALQVGGTTEVGPLELGLRGSMYWWRSLDSDFVFRSEEFGNLPTAYTNGKSRIGDVTAFVRFEPHEDWPVGIFGRYARNFTADDGFCTLWVDAGGDVQPINCDPGFMPPGTASSVAAGTVDEEDMAWGIGAEVGSSKKWLKLGFGYFYIEANAIMSQFGDSDILDGFTNRQGWVIYGSRRIAKNTEFKFAYYTATYIDNDMPLARSVFLS
jgi:hypothetical protein